VRCMPLYILDAVEVVLGGRAEGVGVVLCTLEVVNGVRYVRCVHGRLVLGLMLCKVFCVVFNIVFCMPLCMLFCVLFRTLLCIGSCAPCAGGREGCAPCTAGAVT